MTFGDVMKRLREESGLTQAGLADKAGLSARTIQSWEQGRRAPVSPDFFKLVRALGVSADAFAHLSEPKPRGRPLTAQAKGEKRRKGRAKRAGAPKSA